MAKSVHDDLGRRRKPRVHIRYDVDIGDAQEKRELPFVVGVLGDFSGDPTEKLKPFRDREFIQIDRDNFAKVMKRMTPGANFRVENTLEGDGSELSVQLKFESMEDFEPANIAKQVKPLQKLLETRNKLRDLLTRIDMEPEYEGLWEEVLKNTEQLQKLESELGGAASDSEKQEDES
ncbi:MAG: type VI secretion system contractile sheath small subunit [Candidatus Nealsonbacteria bacterium]|nr:type VI secretion system contractile sheath small subunit [Candidatus Nealsonbacteria bacterium]